ncbi:MAG: tRNA (N(6)-L-threonylcarbamoyladenosine(37)-C(2))-methylthiotransferase MtaB [Alphaproteobacteria bacterium]|nr:tRNA (N(6)-L-threonylcarbamoyladenosine(37)-C(2))-methylthiotransferase MtaB [Alphaproteobacteria bacterium]
MKIVTFGCRINTYESTLIRSFFDEGDNVIVINSCAVTAEAERQCRQTIRKLACENPKSKIVVTGCAVQLHPELYAEMPEVSLVLGNCEKLLKECYQKEKGQFVSDIRKTDFDIPLVRDFEGKSRAFIQVQQGCDNNCTFCVVRLVRGKNKGLLPETVIEEIRGLIQKGFSEIVLTGVDLTSYPYGLSDLTELILKEVPDLKRLRFGFLDPAGVDEKLIKLYQNEERIMPHAHFSIQAGDNLVLKRMGRRHTREQVIELTQKLKEARPDMIFGADLITGFPTETEEAFQNTMDLVRRCPITLLHVFPFSVRQETPSSKMPAVPVAVRKERAFRLRALGKEIFRTYLNSQVGFKEKVLVEDEGVGYNMHYIKTRVDPNIPVGEIVEVINKGVSQDEFLEAS